jgi:hypothetical protein
VKNRTTREKFGKHLKDYIYLNTYMNKKRNRSLLGQDATRTSPPYKMNRTGGFNPNNQSGSNHNSSNNQRQFTLADVMDKLDRIEGEIAGIWRKFEEMDALKQEVKELRKTTESFQRFEIDQKKKCILVKGLASASKERYESRMDTKKSLDEMFNYLDFHPNLDDYQRLGELKKNETENTLIRVKFASLDDKNALFAKFKENGHLDELKKISLINDYPLFQLSEVKRLSQVAYDIRKAEKGTKTRIIPRGLGVILQRKGGTEKWMNVSVQTEQ